MKKNIYISLLLCLLGGYLGLHRFYEKKNKSGILWLCTAGVCGVGWIVDLLIIICKILKQHNMEFSFSFPNKSESISSKAQACITKTKAEVVSMTNGVTSEAKIYLGDTINVKQAVVSEVPSEIPYVDMALSDENNKKAVSAVSIVTDAKPSVKIDEAKIRREEAIKKKQDEFVAALSSIPRVDIVLSDEKITRKSPSDMPEIAFTNITRATNIEKLFPLVVIDTETTGLQVRGNDIIEVSAIKYDVGFKPVSCFTTLLKPRKPIPAEASAVNHITDDMVNECPTFAQIATALSEYISGCNVVGHNVMFDLKFLFVCGATLPENVRYYDTLELAKKTLTDCKSKTYDYHNKIYNDVIEYDVLNYKLETLCEYYCIYRSDAHRSLSDCYATGMLFENLINDKRS